MPTIGRYLLDTNVIIALLQGDQGVVSNIELAAEVFIPVIAIGELLFGAARSGRPAENAAICR
jgi:tRNA(fMet)-specific endonuclease VapC